MSKSYTLYIKAYTPETIPMARLAQYMQNLATLVHLQCQWKTPEQLQARL